MSQQNPQNPGDPQHSGGVPPMVPAGGPGWAAPPGAPGGGVPYGAPPGAPGGGVPYGAPPQGQPGRKPPWLAIGLGCGLLTLVVIVGTVFALIWLRNRANSTLEDVQRQLASATAAVAAIPAKAPVGAQSRECAQADACCRAIAAKATGNDAAIQACDVFKATGYPVATCATSLEGYRKVAKSIGVTCD